jgi:ABC-type polysaccharide/polyol phosphate export permease
MDVYADLFRYRELFSNLFRRDLQAKYKGSVLGVAWSLVTPIMLMAIYFLVFSVIWRQKFKGVDHYALFLLSGLVCWTFIATTLPNSSVSMLSNANLIRKVRFPRQLIPLSVVGTQLVSFGAVLVLVGILDAILLPRVRATAILALPLAALLVLFVAGLALTVASANVLFRDIEHLTNAMLLPLFFLSPIIYPLDGRTPGLGAHPTLRAILHWGNPLVPAINAVRAPLYSGSVDWGDTAYLAVAAVLSLLLGASIFRRLDDRIAVEL